MTTQSDKNILDSRGHAQVPIFSIGCSFSHSVAATTPAYQLIFLSGLGFDEYAIRVPAYFASLVAFSQMKFALAYSTLQRARGKANKNQFLPRYHPIPHSTRFILSSIYSLSGPMSSCITMKTKKNNIHETTNAAHAVPTEPATNPIVPGLLLALSSQLRHDI